MSKSDGDSPWGCVIFGVLAVWTGFSFILLGDIRQMKEAPSIVIFITYLPAVSIIFGIILLALRVFYAEFVKPLLPKVKRDGPPMSDETLWSAITEKPKDYESESDIADARRKRGRDGRWKGRDESV